MPAHSKFKASLSYTVTPCFKKTNTYWLRDGSVVKSTSYTYHDYFINFTIPWVLCRSQNYSGGASKHWVNVQAAKPEDGSLIPRTFVVEGQN